MYILYYNIKQIVKCSFDDLDIDTADDIDGLAISIKSDGNIKEISTSKLLWRKYDYEKYVDCKGGSVIPGFVDGHTHPVWAGCRINEFRMKLDGATYLDIHNSGGGIHSSVAATQSATDEELYTLLKHRLISMINNGTTTVECKTGYGLDWETELKMLQVLNKAKEELPIDISITYLPAHAIPKGSTSRKYAEDIVNNQIPELKKLLQNKKLSCNNIDVFCEKGIFEIEETKMILEAGLNIGLQLNVHSDELYNIGGTDMICNLSTKARKSISHLEKVDKKGIDSMSKTNATAVLLPSTAYLLRLEPPPVRQMLDSKVRCCLGSDFNPNAYCLSMPIIMNLACVTYKMSMSEALLGATINAAYSMGMEHKVGSLEPGKQADFLVLKVSNWENLIYQLGEASQLISMVIKKGKQIN